MVWIIILSIVAVPLYILAIAIASCIVCRVIRWLWNRAFLVDDHESPYRDDSWPNEPKDAA